MTRAELVFVPAPIAGHIISTVTFAKLLADRHPLLSVTIFTMDSLFDPRATAYAHTAAAALSQSRVRFLHLPLTAAAKGSAPSSFSEALNASIEAHKPSIRDGVAELIAGSESPRLGGFVVDMFCLSMVDVANEFGAPTYLFYTSGAAMLGFSLHLQAMHDDGSLAFADFIDSDAEMAVPGFSNPVPAGKLAPSALLDKAESAYFIDRVRKFRETRGILVNTFEDLQSHALKSLREPDSGVPPIYPVGPVINLAGEEEEEILDWLDGQPPSSVVFLCFGSMGCFDAEQMREIACGLEQSGYRFLWSLRRPPPSGGVQPGEYSDPEEALPEGFLKRTERLGRVMGWAPQAAVLSHEAVGGFVSHCGWNSVLESLWFGVPIATWPMYADQQVNAFWLTTEVGVAEKITVEYKRDLGLARANMIVSGAEVEGGIRRLMEEGGEARKKVQLMREASRKAVGSDGSSSAWARRFVDEVIRDISD